MKQTEASVAAAKLQAPYRCLFFNTFYDGFLTTHYQRHPELATASYDAQKASLEAECFGDSDFYSVGLIQAGWEAVDIIANCVPLQTAWAQENAGPSHLDEVAIAQIQRFQPDVVYMQDMGLGSRDFLAQIRPHTKLIVGQIASQVPAQTHLSGYDLIITSFPHFAERFRNQGIASYYQPLAFEPRVLEKLPRLERAHPVTFVGGLSAAHSKGREFLEKLARLLPMDFWGYGAESLAPDSAIRGRHHGPVWGLDMFSRLAQSRITINRHIDVAEHNANNMRLFEATGCGALLITDHKDNLSELFEIGREVVAYRDAEECAALVRYYLAHPQEADAIAKAGQVRTLRDHTYAQRMAQTAELLERHLRSGPWVARSEAGGSLR